MNKLFKSNCRISKFKVGVSLLLILILPLNFADPVASTYTSEPETGSNQSYVDENKVVLNFENADIPSVIKAISKLSGKNFVIDPRVKGTVTIVSDKPISKADSYKVLESALRMQGFACVESDGVIKVLPESDAKTYNMRFSDSKSAQVQGDQLITKVFVLSHGSANQMSNVIRPLMSPNNVVSVYALANALVVTDYASNISRITKVINQLTDGKNSEISNLSVVIPLKHATAIEVAQTLQSYLQGGSGGGGGYSQMQSMMQGEITANVTVVPSTNSLIISSALKSKLNELKDIALSIDEHAAQSNNFLHVVYLKNADANHVADVLRAVASGQEDPDITASSSQFKFASEPGSTFATTGSSASGGVMGSSGGGVSGGGTSTRPSSSRNMPSVSSAQNQKDMPKVLIQAEPTTNSLIIQAPDTIYKNLRMIIDMLDIRRAEILIEAVLVDINQEKAGNFGVQWIAGAGNNNLGVGMIGNYGRGDNSLSSLATSAMGAAAAKKAVDTGGSLNSSSLPSIPNQFYVGLVTNTVSVAGQTIPAVGMIADMLAQSDMANIISRPSVIVMDNEEAKVLVGTNIGVPNGSVSTASGMANLTTTYTRTDFGTVLQIKPLITENGAIHLDLYQEDSSQNLAAASKDNPAFSKRSLRTSLVVDDGQIIVLGGMVQDTVELHGSGIPGLSSIPYLGWLFKWQSRIHKKSNLVLFLQPTIIKNAEGYRALTNSRYKHLVGQQNLIKATGNLLLPNINPVTLDNQVPYKNEVPHSDSSGLNLNKDLPIIDLRHDHLSESPKGDMTNKESAVAVTTKVAEVTPATTTTLTKSDSENKVNSK